ncbi:bifunctional [glutamine synthetase] adenylyltransferase/[glutamine synthetase]-adenylyl-L-tyrosine phosphorylase [Marinivivus vitaminiproducens]|uniref:bifunctional [glutamine synthetase] adenylyltransferase/[glutamine synthetase]-adenylyl-L-tyrosine phosphorylase n=1 Tax=Marinivivus vitaminiproducens TaxID=3035935 RepID=UPI0027991973|nr:bifunctional [glutamine synthetase] adenylyltransferase/[glutamine synthetase]-adenylyl-L-tyrosine phosphorylase [Geminicoccaceae bacterium SCSIO 64248]
MSAVTDPSYDPSTPHIQPPVRSDGNEQHDRFVARWQAMAGRQADRAVADAMPALIDDERLGPILRGIFAHSPYLSESLLAEPDIAVATAHGGIDEVWRAIQAETEGLRPTERRQLMRAMRRLKRRAALAIALADLAGLWPLDTVTRALSTFADHAIRAALAQALDEARARGDLIGDAVEPESSGIVVVSMGKLGAYELNYSSDVDLIVLFEPKRMPLAESEAPMALAVRIVRTFTYLLSDVGRDGYVLRTDLRLRPHPAGHPLALSVEDALEYYERHGQNWERAALIKARVSAGDPVAGARFLDGLRPFIWRRHLDFAAIQDIHSIKRQIDRYRGHGSVKLAGHDLKVGRGGIREIEFFVQTQQLILGGRHPELRTARTCDCLTALADGRWIEPVVAEELTGSYVWLRQAEHRLQMIEDMQTQKVPERPRLLLRFAQFMGYPDTEALEDALALHLRRVEAHYAYLFETSPDLGGGGALVFTGTDDDLETLENLTAHGFADAKRMSARIRGWHHGHIRATRSSRARELLTELMPQLIAAWAAQPSPDAAFVRFDAFVSQLPGGVQLFALLHANPDLLRLLADVMGAAPRLAGEMAHHTGLFEAMLEPDFLEAVPAKASLASELETQLRDARDPQDGLDRARQWAHGREFQIGLGVLLGRIDGALVGDPLSDIAEIVLARLLRDAEAGMRDVHGQVPDGRYAVVAMGKLGSRELGLGSDLDLIFLFDGPEDASSDGPRPLPAGDYYARLTQRLTGALTARTRHGRLYDIDMRLRPSGNAGFLVSRLATFDSYQRNVAQTWEHQALTRARAVVGHPQLLTDADAAIRSVLSDRAVSESLAADIHAMRMRIFREHGTDDPWRVKHVRGGVVELEFLAQYLQLRHAGDRPDLLERRATRVFTRAASHGLLDAETADLVSHAWRLYTRLDQVLRLAIEGRFESKAAPIGLQKALIRAATFDDPLDERNAGVDFTTLEARLAATERAVAAAFDRLLGPGCSTSEDIAT